MANHIPHMRNASPGWADPPSPWLSSTSRVPRAGAAWFGILVLAAALLFVTLLILRMPTSLPLALALLVAAVGAALLTAVVGAARSSRRHHQPPSRRHALLRTARGEDSLE
jgi:uncharacterized integral membrane protein